MNNNQFSSLLDDESAINIQEPSMILGKPRMFKMNYLKKAILGELLNISMESIEQNDSIACENLKLINEGLKCEILKLGLNNWKKGKVRINISLEFCPDEPEISQYESPLDEIRREMNQGL